MYNKRMDTKMNYAQLEAEYKKLLAENSSLSTENTKLKNKVSEPEKINFWLKEQQRLANRRRFGQSSEKTPLPGQLSLFNEAEELAILTTDENPESLELPPPKRKKRQGKRDEFFQNLPTEQIVHELPLEERICPCCNQEMHPCGKSVLRKEVEVIPVQVKVIEHVQVAYSCRKCEKTANKVPMKTSKVPAPVIQGSGVASPSLVALVLCNKYLLALPLNRQEQEFKRLGLHLSRQTLANWVVFVADKLLRPIYDRLRLELLANDILHGDETTVQVMQDEGKTAEQKSYMWTYLTGYRAKNQVVLFEYEPTREAKHPLNFMEGFDGFLHTDAYGGYKYLEKQGVTLVGCWAHARRKFNDVL